MTPDKPPETYDLRTPEQRLATLIATVERQSAELARLNHQYVRLLERQEKIERQFALLSQIQGELALQADDDLDASTSLPLSGSDPSLRSRAGGLSASMAPGVAVWPPVEVDE